MKYQTATAFLTAARNGEFRGEVIVDNDGVNVYEPDPFDAEDHVKVYDFSGNGPEGALILVLQFLNIKAERA